MRGKLPHAALSFGTRCQPVPGFAGRWSIFHVDGIDSDTALVSFVVIVVVWTGLTV